MLKYYFLENLKSVPVALFSTTIIDELIKEKKLCY